VGGGEEGEERVHAEEEQRETAQSSTYDLAAEGTSSLRLILSSSISGKAA
jgi:hypothetical protein